MKNPSGNSGNYIDSILLKTPTPLLVLIIYPSSYPSKVPLTILATSPSLTIILIYFSINFCKRAFLLIRFF